MRSWVLITALFCAAPSFAFAKSVAVAVSGSKSSGEDKLDAKIKGQLSARGIEVVSEKALSKAAKKIGESANSEAAAKEAGADLWISVSIKKVKKKFVANAKLVDLATGKTLKSSKRTYKKASSAGAIGDLLGTELAEAAAGKASTLAAETDEPEEDDEPGSKVVKPKEEEEPAAVARPTPSVTPKDEEKTRLVATLDEPAGQGKNGENKVLSLQVAGGSQITSAYTVAVGPQVTGLAYSLTPLVLLDVGVAVQIPNVGLSFELGLAYVPVKYQIDVDPAVDPTGPTGSFLDVGGGALYRIVAARFGEDRASNFYISPQVGFQYNSLSVEDQAPYAVVLSNSAIAPYAGVRTGVLLDNLALEVDGRFKLIVSYSEAPSQTGDSGSGTGFVIGGRARYWMSENFGVSFRIAYDFSKVGFSGEGSRTPFVDDPALIDASAFSNSLRASIGVVLAI
jgi:hypothetical protein